MEAETDNLIAKVQEFRYTKLEPIDFDGNVKQL